MRRALGKWLVAPLAFGLAGAALGHWRVVNGRGPIHAGAAGRPAPERQALESAPALAVANAIWAFGTADAVKGMARTELDRLPAAEAQRRARVLVRFGIVDTNFDGQAALFGYACQADQNLCTPEQVKQAVEQELRARFVYPNVLPTYVVGHPTLGQK
jgi:hypothetical protein